MDSIKRAVPRRVFAFLMLLALGACGFSPMANSDRSTSPYSNTKSGWPGTSPDASSPYPTPATGNGSPGPGPGPGPGNPDCATVPWIVDENTITGTNYMGIGNYTNCTMTIVVDSALTKVLIPGHRFIVNGGTGGSHYVTVAGCGYSAWTTMNDGTTCCGHNGNMQVECNGAGFMLTLH